MRDKIVKWLEGQGYPLEMRVASALRAVGLWVRQSTHYLDPESGKSREIDVLASEVEPHGVAELHFVVECKTSNKPWVLFTSLHTLSNYNRLFAFGIYSHKALHALSEHGFEELVSTLEWIKKDGRAGYNLTPAFGSGEDTAYSAAYSAIKAFLSLLQNKRGSLDPLVFVFPAIVIDAPLFECYMDESGQIVVEEITDGWLFFDARIPHFRGTCIRIVSQLGLNRFSSEVKDTKVNLLKVISKDIENEWQSFMDMSQGRRKIRLEGDE